MTVPARYLNSKYFSTKKRKAANVYVNDTYVPTVVKMLASEIANCKRDDGLDFVITDIDGNLIPREIVGFSKSLGTGHYWYRDPSISTSSGGTEVYAQYGGESVNVANSQSVWQDCHGGTSDYVLTCHLESSAANSASNSYQPITESFSYVTGEIGNHGAVGASTADSSHGNIAEIQGAAALTVICWWTISDIDSFGYISNQWSGANDKHQIITIAGTPATLGTWIGGGGVDTNGTFSESGVISNNVPFHLASVFNGAGADNAGRLQMYIDGVSQTLSYSGTIPSSIGNPTGNFTIGQYPWTLVGSADEFRIFLGALSINQVKNSYDNENGFSTNASITESDTFSFGRSMQRFQTHFFN